MPNILSLPPELVAHICSSLDSETPRPAAGHDGESGINRRKEAQTTLYHICLASRKLCAIAQPILYRSFHVNCKEQDDGRTVLSFARTISLRPDLAKQVTSLAIEDSVGPMYGGLNHGESLTAEDYIFFKNVATESLGFSESDVTRFLPKRYGHIFAFADFLIGISPNIQVLTIGQPGFRYLETLLRYRPSALSRLEHLKVNVDDADSGYEIRNYSQFLLLPSLKRAEFELGDLIGEYFPTKWTTEGLKLHSIGFRGCFMDADAATKLMQACGALKKFFYLNWALDPAEQRAKITIPQDPEADAAQFYEAALLRKDTLEELSLSFYRDPMHTNVSSLTNYMARSAKLGSFGDFAALRKLEISQAICPLHPTLPPNIETFTIVDCPLSFIETINAVILDVRSGFYPKFTSFNIFTSDPRTAIGVNDQRHRSDITEDDFLYTLDFIQQSLEPFKVKFQLLDG